MPVIPALGAVGSAALYSGVASAVVGIGTSLIGGSMQASAQQAAAEAQMQEAENTRAIAQYNANIQRQNNQVSYQMALYQASYSTQLAQMNQAMMIGNAQMAETQGAYARKAYEQEVENAKQKELQASASRAQAREAADREREKNRQQLATIRSKYGAAGVAFEGSPLVVLAEAARLGESAVQDIAYSGELQSRKELREAEIERFKGYGTLLEAKGFDVEAMNFRNRAAMYGYESNLYEFDSAIAGAKFRIGENQARLVELGGEAKAQSYEFAAYQSSLQAQASLIGGFTGAASAAVGGITSGITNYGYITGKIPYRPVA